MIWQNFIFRDISRRVVCFLVAFAGLGLLANAQSTNQNTPTAVTSNEISGTIKARALGDPRLTNFYYTFNGEQGDVFVNIVTKNLDGDIDIFIIDGLRPLTKITLFSDNSENETGRIVYLRKPERLLLRVQGRSPNDESATFRIKFAGSFKPLASTSTNETPDLPNIDTSTQGEVRVNSVGTILGAVTKPTPEKPAPVESLSDKEIAKSPKTLEINVTSSDQDFPEESSARIEIRRTDSKKVNVDLKEKSKDETTEPGKPVVVTTDTLDRKTEKDEVSKSDDKPDSQDGENAIQNNERKNIESSSKSRNVVSPMLPEDLRKIELVVRFKNGDVLKQPMDKVFSFNVNQGILTIVTSEGNISKYSLREIEKISIE